MFLIVSFSHAKKYRSIGKSSRSYSRKSNSYNSKRKTNYLIKSRTSSYMKSLKSDYQKRKAKKALDNSRNKKYKNTNKPYQKTRKKVKITPTRIQRYRQKPLYRNYNPPTYVYESRASFGAWDAMFLWMMLDKTSNHDVYYHHKNDPAFREWRAEADRLAKDNLELKAKLAKLDESVKTHQGTPVNPNYIPKDINKDDLFIKDNPEKSVSNTFKGLALFCFIFSLVIVTFFIIS